MQQGTLVCWGGGSRTHPPAAAHAPQERALGQKFVVDATLALDLREAGRSDDLAHTVNYAAVYE